jgi:N-methylhydantoinase A
MQATFEQPLFMTQPFDLDRMNETLAALEARARQATAAEAPYVEDFWLERTANCKYGLQVYEVEAAIPPGTVTEASAAGLIGNFERTYEERFGAGAGYREAGIVITGFRVRAHGRVRKPTVVERGAVEGVGLAGNGANRGERSVYWEELAGRVPTAVYDGVHLAPGAVVPGPAIVEFPDTTIVVRPDSRASVDHYGNAVVQIAGGGSS